MDPQVSNSFIPKKPLVQARGRAGASSLLLLLAILAFIASGVAAGGLFAYERYLEGSIASKDKSLQLAQAAYEPGVINSLIRLDTRINESEALLNKHIAPSAIFSFLADQTLERVQLTSFSYLTDEGGAASLELVGIADTFSTLALQSKQFGNSNVLRNVVFSNIVIAPASGKVSFTVYADIDPSFIAYAKNLNNNVVPLPPVETAPATTTPTSTSPTQ